MSLKTQLAGVALALATACILPTSRADDAALGRWFGSVKNVAGDGARFDLHDKTGTYRITLERAAEVAVVREVPVKDFSRGVRVHVLGSRSAEGRGPAAVSRVVVIVASASYVPPELTADQREKRLQWLSGPLRFDKGRWMLGDACELKIGGDQPIVSIETASRAALAGAKLAFVEGSASGSGAARTVAATRVTVFSPAISASESGILFRR